jgi:hypothetical protein
MPDNRVQKKVMSGYGMLKDVMPGNCLLKVAKLHYLSFRPERLASSERSMFERWPRSGGICFL